MVPYPEKDEETHRVRRRRKDADPDELRAPLLPTALAAKYCGFATLTGCTQRGGAVR